MRKVGNDIALTIGELTNAGLTAANLRKIAERVRNDSAVDIYLTKGGNGRVAEVSYLSLPEKWRTKLDSYYPPNVGAWLELEADRTRKALVEGKKIEDCIVVDSTLYDAVLQHHITYGLSVDNAYQIAQASAIIELYNSTIGKNGAGIYGFANKQAMLVGIQALALKKGLKCLYTANLRRFAHKFTCYKTDGWKCLVSKKIDNKNSLKLNNEQKEVITQLLGRVQNFDYTKVWSDYCRIADQKGWKTVCAATIKAFCTRPEVQTLVRERRLGKRAWGNVYDAVVTRQRPSKPNLLWVSDSTTVNLYYQKRTNNRATYHNRKTINMVIDAYNDLILGYSLSDSETETAVVESYKNAVNYTNCLPYQVKMDNGSANGANKDLFLRLARYVTPSKVGNARDKVIEQFFGKFEVQFLKPYLNYSGGNIEAKSDLSTKNRDWLETNKKHFPEEQGIFDQVAEAVAQWNQTILKNGVSRLEQWTNADHTLNRAYTSEQYLNIFGIERPHTIRYTNKGILLTDNKQVYQYTTWDTEQYHQMIGRDFRITFLPEKPEAIRVESTEKGADGHFISAYLKMERKTPMAYMDFEEGDRALLNQKLKMKDEYIDKMRQINAEQMSKVLAEGQIAGFFTEYGRNKEALRIADDVMHQERVTPSVFGKSIYED